MSDEKLKPEAIASAREFASAQLPRKGGVGRGRGVKTIRRAHIEDIIVRGGQLRLNVTLDNTELRYIAHLLGEYDLDDPHAAIKVALHIAATTGSRFSAVQRLKMRQIVSETRGWVLNRISEELSKIYDDVTQSTIEAEEELRRVREELEGQ